MPVAGNGAAVKGKKEGQTVKWADLPGTGIRVASC